MHFGLGGVEPQSAKYPLPLFKRVVIFIPFGFDPFFWPLRRRNGRGLKPQWRVRGFYGFVIGLSPAQKSQYETQRIKGKEGVVVCDNIVLTEAEAGYWTPSSITHFTL